MYGSMVVENLVDLDALFEFWIEAVLQVGLTEPPMVVVMVFRKDLSNMAPLYVLTAISKGPWFLYILPTFECQLL
jgi:hypothetical protein